MLEQLFYPNFVGEFDQTREYRQLADMQQRIQNGDFDGEIPGMKDADTPAKQNALRKQVFEAALEKAEKQKAAFEAPKNQTLQLWQGAFALLEQDPMLQEYMQQKNIATAGEALEQLQQHFAGREGQTPEGESVSESLKELKTAYDSLKMITEHPGTLRNPLKGFGGSIPPSGQNEIGKLIVSVNHLNGTELDTGLFKQETSQTLSLLDRVYRYHEQTGYKDIVGKNEKKEDAEQIEPLLAIHLGELTRALATQLKAIEVLTPAYEQQSKAQLQEIREDQDRDFLEKMKDPVRFLESYGENQKELEKIVQDCDAFLLGSRDARVDIIENNEEFLDLYNKYMDEAAKDTVEAAKKQAEAQHTADLKKLYSRLKQEQQERQQANAEALAAYEEQKKAHSETLRKIEELTKGRDAIVNRETPKLEKLRARKQAAIQRAELNEGEPLKYQWKKYNEKKADLENQIADIKFDRARYEAYLPKVEKKQGSLEKQLNRLDQEAKGFTQILDYFHSLTQGSFDARASIINFAIGSRNITADDITEALNDTEHLERVQGLQTAMNVQVGWEIFKQQHPELKEQCSLIDSFRGSYKDAREDGAYDILNREIADRKLKYTQLRAENRDYLDAVDIVRGLEARYGGKSLGEEKLESLVQELKALEVPEMTYEAWQEELQKWADENYKEVSEFETGLEGFRKKRNAEIQQLQKELEEAGVREPELLPVKTDKEIEKELAQADKKFREEELPKILDEADEQYAIDHEEEGMEVVAEKLRLAKKGAEKELLELKYTCDKMKSIYDKGLREEERRKEARDELTLTRENLEENKNAFYESIYRELAAFSVNMDKGKAKGHSNTEEFQLMVQKVNRAKELFAEFGREGGKPARKDMEQALTELKAAADHYHGEKLKGWHPWPSPMRQRRLRMSENLSAFVEDKMKTIDSFEKQFVAMNGKLQELETRAEAQKKTDLAVQKGEDPLHYWDRIWLGSYRERKDEAVKQKQEVAQMKLQTKKKEEPEVKNEKTETIETKKKVKTKL